MKNLDVWDLKVMAMDGLNICYSTKVEMQLKLYE